MAKYAFPLSVQVPYATWMRILNLARCLHEDIKNIDPDKISQVTDFFSRGPDRISMMYEHILEVQEKLNS